MGSIGGQEFLLLAVLALLLFGPRKLPQIGRSIGKAMAEFRGATREFRTTLEREVQLEELNEARDGILDVRREIADTVDAATRPVPRAGGPSDVDRTPDGAAGAAAEPGASTGGPADGETRAKS